MRKLEPSPYYPPRARWYGALFRLAAMMRRITWLDRLYLPAEVSLPKFIAALFIPGLAFRFRRERIAGSAILASYLLLALVFVIWLGYPVANLAFGAMLSLHVTSVIYLCNPWLANARLGYRLLMSVAILTVIGGLLYAPLRARVQERWLMPLRIGDNVVVVQTFSSPQSVRRGDWIAYTIEGERGNGLVVRSGLVLQPVLAVAGDRVRFTAKACEVNDVKFPRLGHMPTTGELTVPEKHWFIWPNLAINLHGNAAATMADATLLRLADVEQSQFVGKPFERWFGRRQILQ